jgi:hypothetical protein
LRAAGEVIINLVAPQPSFSLQLSDNALSKQRPTQNRPFVRITVHNACGIYNNRLTAPTG